MGDESNLMKEKEKKSIPVIDLMEITCEIKRMRNIPENSHSNVVIPGAYGKSLKIFWQLPVIQSNKTDHEWVHPKAKYHAYIDNKSVCGRYVQSNHYFGVSIEESELLANKNLACKVCLKKLGKC
ncbi:hypothetical protein [Bacillus subtilis]|uniref:hypothetical protein n=1 Tax=Bacillus subtilis TaxID=1423 RepID=UPI00059D1140|nr:hypothetical protein [Bacillus subtilis]